MIQVDPVIAAQMSNRFTQRAEGENRQRCRIQGDLPIHRINFEHCRPGDLQLALDYLDAIKTRFANQPDVVQRFFEIMHAFKDGQ